MRAFISAGKLQLIRKALNHVAIFIPNNQDPWFFLCADENLSTLRTFISTGIFPTDENYLLHNHIKQNLQTHGIDYPAVKQGAT